MRRTDYFLLVFYKPGAIFEDGQLKLCFCWTVKYNRQGTFCQLTMNKCHASLPPNQISFFDFFDFFFCFFKLKIFQVWQEEGRSRTESEDKHIIKLIVKLNKVVASSPPRFAVTPSVTPSELTKVHCCLNSYRLHCIVISCILLFSSVFSAV